MIDLLKPLVNKFERIIILGFGREGRSSYRLLRKLFPKLPLVIADVNMAVSKEGEWENDTHVQFFTGTNYLKVLQDKALVFKSPGVKVSKDACHFESLLTSQTDLFIQKFHGQMIGVSGTKGKSTTSSLVAYLLKSANHDAVLLGNIGIPAFDKLDVITADTWIVFELSAHQLQHVQHSPHMAILLNIFPEHLDYFDDFESYKQAKMNLFNFQNQKDILIVPSTLHLEIVEPKGEVLSFSEGKSVNVQAWFNSVNFGFKDKVFSFPELHLKGLHNKSNVVAAMLAVAFVGVKMDEMLLALPNFKGLAHRLEYVGEKEGVTYYNDSISTIPASAMAAVQAVGEVGCLILGGFDRGLDYHELVNFLKASDVKCFVFVGGAGKRMMELFHQDFDGELFLAATFPIAVSWAQQHTPKGKICLLSPAAASYDEFHNFEHRGDTFKRLVMTCH